MEVECYRVTLKPDSVETVREWAKRLTDEKNEMKKLTNPFELKIKRWWRL